jgi:peptidoglycan/LPS O-acetylase OafA/YrhL
MVLGLRTQPICARVSDVFFTHNLCNDCRACSSWWRHQLAVLCPEYHFPSGIFCQPQIHRHRTGLVPHGRRVFYFAAPLLLFRWKKSIYRNCLLACGVTYAVGWILWQIGQILDVGGFFTPARFVILYTFFGRVFEFVVGAFVAKMVLQRNRVPGNSGAAVAVWGGMLGAAGLLMWLSHLSGGSYRFGIYHPVGTVIYLFPLPVCIGLMLYGLLGGGTLMSSLLATKWCEFLGRISYTFYLVHLGWFASQAKEVSARFCQAMPFLGSNWLVLWCLTLGLLVALSAVLYLLVEEPLRKWLAARSPSVQTSFST